MFFYGAKKIVPRSIQHFLNIALKLFCRFRTTEASFFALSEKRLWRIYDLLDSKTLSGWVCNCVLLCREFLFVFFANKVSPFSFSFFSFRQPACHGGDEENHRGIGHYEVRAPVVVVFCCIMNKLEIVKAPLVRACSNMRVYSIM